jgi:hypothetical protein
MKIVKGYGSGVNEELREWRLWIVIESEVAGDETMSGFIAKSEAGAFYNALRSHSLADAEKLRRAALVRLEHGKYTTPAVFTGPEP